MIQAVKYIAIILLVSVSLFGISQMNSCFDNPVSYSGADQSLTVKPKDERFADVEYKEHQVSSNPFSDKTMKGELPFGIKEKDVEQIISVGVKRENDSLLILDLIETREGEVFLKRDSAIEFVTVTRFEPALFSFCLKYGVGMTGALSGEQGVESSGRGAVRVSPAISLSFAEWNVAGLSFHAPVFAADFDGIGVGVQTRLYHDIYIGIIRERGWGGDMQWKAMVGMVF